MLSLKYVLGVFALLLLFMVFQGCIDNTASNSVEESEYKKVENLRQEKFEEESFEKETFEKEESNEGREERFEREEGFENEENEMNEFEEENGNTNISVNLTVVGNITLQELSKHNSKNDCWMAINGKVYDVTSFINQHPGGEAILQGCGKDATDLYMTRPMGSGTPHSSNANSLLKNYYIGDLIK